MMTDDVKKPTPEMIKASTEHKVMWKAGQFFYKLCAKCKAHYMFEWKVCQARFGRTAKIKFAERAYQVHQGLCDKCKQLSTEETK
jgi:hypothetical protein